jgi:hypothetical protein
MLLMIAPVTVRHEKVDIELGDARGLCDGAVCLPHVRIFGAAW